jgi:hypothetical protein
VSKESRRRQRALGQASSTPDATSSVATPDATRGGTPTRAASSAGRATGPRGTDRVGRRERARATVKPSFVERYRTLLFAAAAVAVVAVVGVGLFAAATKPAFACSIEWQPDPTSSPAAGTSPQPGYAQPDMGHAHVAVGTQVTYTYCPPASGRHYNAPANGPVTARVYGPGDAVIPEGWVHNLEHGGLVILYKGETADQAALRAAFDAIGPSPVCGFQPGGQSPGPLVVRFDQMTWPYAALVWGRVMPLDTVDIPAIVDFYAKYGEQTNPEKLCTPPSASPSLPGASGSPAATASPSASPS